MSDGFKLVLRAVVGVLVVFSWLGAPTGAGQAARG